MTDKKQDRWRRLLRGAANVLRRNKWIRGHLAMNEYNQIVGSQNPAAVQFCAVGALKNAAKYPNEALSYTGTRQTAYGKAIKALETVVGRDVAVFNDSVAKSKEEVIEAMLKAANQ